MIQAIPRHPDFSALADMLETQREEALVHCQALGDQVQEALDTRDRRDLFDEAPTIGVDVETALTIAAIGRDRIQAIDEALSRISTGTFGLCHSCGCQIPAERLEALPFTEDCVDCARQHHNRGPARPTPTGSRPTPGRHDNDNQGDTS